MVYIEFCDPSESKLVTCQIVFVSNLGYIKISVSYFRKAQINNQVKVYLCIGCCHNKCCSVLVTRKNSKKFSLKILLNDFLRILNDLLIFVHSVYYLLIKVILFSDYVALSIQRLSAK